MCGNDDFLGKVLISLKDKDIVIVEFESEFEFSVGQHLVVLHGLSVAVHAYDGAVHISLFRGDFSCQEKTSGFLLGG